MPLRFFCVEEGGSRRRRSLWQKSQLADENRLNQCTYSAASKGSVVAILSVRCCGGVQPVVYGQVGRRYWDKNGREVLSSGVLLSSNTTVTGLLKLPVPILACITIFTLPYLKATTP